MSFFLRAILNGIKAVLVLLMALIVFTVSYGVFTRYVVNAAAPWTGELAGYTLIWITFLGSAWAVFEKSHIAFDSLVEKLPCPYYVLIQLLFNGMMLLFVSLLTYYGWIVTVNAIHDNTMTLPFTKGVVYAALPISGIIMIIGFLMEMWRLLTGKDEQGKRADEKKAAAGRPESGLPA
ncbi:TRAP transporter small permease [Bacillaceae bacterium]